MGFDTLGQVGVKVDDLGSSSTNPLYALGQKTMRSGNEYIYVYNGGNSAIATGQYAVLQSSGGSYTSGYTCTITSVSQANNMVGVAQNTISTAYYGWLMTRGVSLIAPDSGAISIAAGNFLMQGTDGGFVAYAGTFTTAMLGANPALERQGYLLNTLVTTVGTSKARIFGGVL